MVMVVMLMMHVGYAGNAHAGNDGKCNHGSLVGNIGSLDSVVEVYRHIYQQWHHIVNFNSAHMSVQPWASDIAYSSFCCFMALTGTPIAQCSIFSQMAKLTCNQLENAYVQK